MKSIVSALLVSTFIGGVAHAAEVRNGRPDAAPATSGQFGATGAGEFRPTGKGWGEADSSGVVGKSAAAHSYMLQAGINYHGGPVMLGKTNVYYIWYGNWSASQAPTILDAFATGLNGSPWFNINTTYSDKIGRSVSNSVGFPLGSTVAKSTYKYTPGNTALADEDIWTIVQHAVTGGAPDTTSLPMDQNAVYFVLTSKDVNLTSGFCTQYCGWHTSGRIGASSIKFAFVGNPERCPNACAAQTIGPNGDTAGDGMASVIGHELSEAVTDPDLNAWYDRSGNENADKCAWNFGATQVAANGAHYNVTLGVRKYLIQQNWVNASGGYCAIKK